MSDSYEPDCYAEDEYMVAVLKWRKGANGCKEADECSESVRVSGIDKDLANKIYWNLKNREISFENVGKYFNEVEREVR